MKIKITKCSDSRLWYARLIGEIFLVRRIDNAVYWVKENNEYSGWNWINIADCEEYKEKD